MTLRLISDGNLSDASDINQVIALLQEQPGSQEQADYFLQGGSYQSGWIISLWHKATNIFSTPSSVSIDTSVQAPTATAGTPATFDLKPTGVQIYSVCTGLSNTARCGGKITYSF